MTKRAYYLDLNKRDNYTIMQFCRLSEYLCN